MKSMLLGAMVVFLASAYASAQGRLQAINPREDAILKAAATTNFNARCARDFRWRKTTNELAASNARLGALCQEQSAARKRRSLQRTAGARITQGNVNAAESAMNARLNAERATAAKLQLQKSDLESSIKKTMPPAWRR